MAQPTTQLNATEQDTLVKQIGLALLRAAPRDWRRITAQYRAVGRYHEMSGEVVNEDGSVGEWMATHDIATLFGRLRGGMYREGRGTWFNAKYQLDHPSSYNLEYDRDEPRWDLQPPPQAYADELRMFPRSEENVPDWLMRRMSGLGPEQPGPHFRIARIFDGQGADGQPIINRPEIDADEGERLFTYLNAAPVVLSERGLDLDRLAQPPVPKVPVAYHTDGTWIWPAATNYYLNEYGIAPEADLVAHVRSAGFTLTEVSDHTVQAASAYLNRGNQPPQVPPPPRPPAGTRPVPEQGPPPAATGESDPARASGEDYADSASDAPSAADATRPSKVPPAPDAAGPSDATRPEFGRESTRPEFGGERSGPRFGGAETAAAAGLAGAAAAAVGTAGAGAIRSALNHDDDDAPTDPGHRDYGREQGPAHGEDVAFDDDRPEPGRTDYGRELDQPEHGRPDFAHAEGGRPDTGRSDFVRGSEPPAHPEVEQPTTFTPVIDPDAGPPTEVQAAVTDEPEPEPPSEPAVPSAPFGAGPTATQLVPPVAKHRPEPGSPQADVARPRAEGAAQAPDQGEAGGRPPLEGSARRPEA
ncbi:MAG TPA: hypothetical protein VJ870_12760, partial [Amycolatopsis sp.]|nr:hypothetical protein [Amycolatopsis sp.]